MAMTEEEKFVFDLQGYIVIKDVLTDAEIAELNEVAGTKFPYADPDSVRREEIISTWSPAFTKLIDHPKVVPYLVELIEPKFRIDHDYCIFMTKGNTRGGLHGGPAYGGDHWYSYRDGVMRNGLCVVTFFLTGRPCRRGGLRLHPRQSQDQLQGQPPRRSTQLRPSARVRRAAGCGGGGCPLLHRGPGTRHDAVDSRPRAQGPALQVQPGPLLVGDRTLQPRRLWRSD